MFQPKVMERGAGTFRCEVAPRFYVGSALKRKGAWAYQPLLERLRQRFGPSVRAAVPPAALPDRPCILVGLREDHPALSGMQTPLPPGEEAYRLEVSATRALLTASGPAGVFYGVQTLLSMGGDMDETFSLPAVRIADGPELAWRGMHVLVNSRASLPAVEQLITRHLPRLRLNQLVLEINYNFRYRSHPEIAEENGLTVEDCRRLSRLAGENNVRLIPMINCLGHQSWAERTAKFLRSHPEFDETPDLPPNNPGIYCRSWCPSHPDINRVVYALFDELIDAFQADAFHVGMDEVFILGECPRCKGKDNAELFAKAVNDYHAHLVGKRKVTMMMWGDRLLDSAKTPYGKWEASANGTAPAIDRIPKDIVLCDWHYEKTAYPSVAYFQEKGFRVWPSGWNKAENAQRLLEAGLENRTERMVGYLATTWGSVESVAEGLAADEQGRAPNERVAGLIEAITRTSRMAWEGRRKE